MKQSATSSARKVFSPSQKKWPWRRPQYNAWLAKQDAFDRKRARAFRQELLTLAQTSPMARAALGWAQQNDIVLAVDDGADAYGYYVQDAGVIVVAANAGVDASAVNTLVHEIRHAWQDKMGLLPVMGGHDVACTSLAYHLQRQGMFEADAYAHGWVAHWEVAGNAPGDTRQDLLYLFRHWFDGAEGDTQTAAKAYGQQKVDYLLRLDDEEYIRQLLAKFTLRQFDGARRQPGLIPGSAADLEKLGRSFAGVQYLADLSRDEVLRRFSAAHIAVGDFNMDAGPQPVDVMAVRKNVIRENLSRPPHRPLLPG